MVTAMKKNFLLIAAAIMTATAAQAITAEQFRIYLNPGHGSFTSNDRPQNTIGHPNTTKLTDTLGFFEGRGTLPRSLYIGHTLQQMGVKASNIVFSRTKNGPWPAGSESSTKYNRNLSEICEEVEAGSFDMFLSSHSDALGSATGNHTLYLYRGQDSKAQVPGSREMAVANHPYHLATGIENYSRTSAYIKGDWDFYGSHSVSTRSNGKQYDGYLGVLKHGTPGYLLEGWCHTYAPARHRALNFDYDREEGLREARGIGAYFGFAKLTTGAILGTVKDANEIINHILYTYTPGTDDRFKPLNGATVNLLKDGKVIKTYKTDNEWNGIFAFFDVAPGTYQLQASFDGYKEMAPETITVKANETTYSKLHLVSNADPIDTTPVKGIYAYGLNVKKSADDAYTFSFKANTDARKAHIAFTDAETGEQVGTVDVPNVKEGSNSITIAAKDLPGVAGKDLNWAVTLRGDTIRRVQGLKNLGTYIKVCNTVDKNPESDYFGNIYVTDRAGTNVATNGLYAFGPDWNKITSSIVNKRDDGYYFRYNLRIGCDAQGKVYVSDWGDAYSGVFVCDPANFSAGFTTFFKNPNGSFLSRDSNGILSNASGTQVAGSMSSVFITGSGASTRMYAHQEDLGSNVYRYDIGQADGSIAPYWNEAPSFIYNVGSLLANHNCNVIADEEGNIWVSQIRSAGQNTATVPSLIYADKTGNVLFNSGSDSSVSAYLNGTGGAGFAISNDGKTLVINDANGMLKFFDVKWNGNKPSLTYKSEFAASDAIDTSSSIYQMTFDPGNNLICSGGAVGIYSIPTNDNENTTPAKKALTVVKTASAIPGDVNADGSVDVADINCAINVILGIEPASKYEGRSDVNGDNDTDVADINLIINIILKI